MWWPSITTPSCRLHAFVSLNTLALGSLPIGDSRHLGVGLPMALRLSTRQHWGSPNLRAFRHVSNGLPVPSCLLTCRRWVPVLSYLATRQQRVPCAFDTWQWVPLAFVFRHDGVGLPAPSCLSTCRRWAPWASTFSCPATAFAPCRRHVARTSMLGFQRHCGMVFIPPRRCVVWDLGVVVGVAESRGLRR